MDKTFKISKPLLEEEKNFIDEESIWRDFKKGNKNSFELIYKKFYFVLYNYGFHIIRDKDLVKDCLHDLFFNIWKNKETIIEPISVKNYLFTAFKRKILDAIKAKGRFTNSYNDHDFELISSMENDLISKEVKSEKSTRLVKAMEKLSPKQREAVFLRYFENVDYKDIATMMSYDINSVYVLISKSIDILRKSLITFLFIQSVWMTLYFYN